MSILILGAAGNLGGQLKKIFSKQDCQAWDRLDFDFLNFEELAKRLRALSPSIIINAAAYNAVDRCEENEEEAMLAQRLNAELPGALADYCLEFGSRLIHYSTDYVFGGDGRLSGAYSETDKPMPVNIYGRTKFSGEQEIARRALAGLDYYLIRTSKLFGPKGENPQAKPSFFDIMIALSSKNETVKAIDGEKSCFTYTPDLAAATLSLLTDRPARGIYHLCNSGEATWHEGAKYLFEAIGADVNLQALAPADWPRPAARPQYSALANHRRPRLRPWTEALDEYLVSLGLKK
ncbi:MAG: NAD(P)-dependent oxidoreductase [Patescibacteria group bacterium]|nr:NAD(P)-dependent oxidoreductase [Patescibacteria group bacterium]